MGCCMGKRIMNVSGEVANESLVQTLKWFKVSEIIILLNVINL
jgi:hypothetical protein